MGKMFKTVTSTWNPFTGCKWDCSYCWARKLAEGKMKRSYPNGFIPEFHPNRVNRKFKPGEFIFVSSMGDISFCKLPDFDRINEVIRNHPETKFLFQTKHPDIYVCGYPFSDNVYHGITLETNHLVPMSKALEPYKRYQIMTLDEHPHKFLSIEPIMDFDLVEFSNWIYDIDPEIVEIGADNYKNNLPEPSWDKVSKLIEVLTLHGVKVIQKDGLERLRVPNPEGEK